METQEGLPEYTGVFVALRATGEDIQREAPEIEAWEDSDALARSFGYATGPALGLLLDRYAVGWRTQRREHFSRRDSDLRSSRSTPAKPRSRDPATSQMLRLCSCSRC